ncbi:ABC transporter ATP-binding protein [Marinobacterium rhizophilum]|uniref:ABC transporter ATP-binding protein n=2 Tax=Marinobacterium rhizophilum TaxID=420402 RepID=A0ABY5HQ89_9GAMM|nr:ABC transporter ATP-binding protein [Marinobacterium rhizophilum]
MTELVIRADGICKHYGRGQTRVQVLRGLCFELAAGESVAIMGPSGCGKSTLLNLLNGLIRPDEGTLELFGQPCQGLSDNAWAGLRRTRVATLFQDGNLVSTLNVVRNIAFRAGLAGLEVEPLGLLRALGIAEVAQRYPDQLSGGQRQRAALACAFAVQPELILADEPTGSLDETSARRVMPLFFEAMHERGLTALIVTHNPSLARCCDRVLELSNGALRP